MSLKLPRPDQFKNDQTKNCKHDLNPLKVKIEIKFGNMILKSIIQTTPNLPQKRQKDIQPKTKMGSKIFKPDLNNKLTFKFKRTRNR